jgi:ATP-dependent Lon protease
MYKHHKDNQFRQYLKFKAKRDKFCFTQPVDFNRLPEVTAVFDIDKMHAMTMEHERKSNLYRNHQRYLNFLDDTAGHLELATLPADIFQQLEALRLAFPNFSEVIDFYREQFALAELSGSRTFTANPVLISGGPGIGKTAFCHALAKIVETHFELISFSSMTAGFVVGGSSSNWADGKPGKVVEALARGLKANPLITLDELDKSGGDKRYDPLGALYQLLEKETSASFVDEGLEVAVNWQHIVWAATANYLEKIAEPILSRFTVIDVKRPDASQMGLVLRSIYRKVRQAHTWGKMFSEELPAAVVDKVVSSALEPRLIQRELIAACGKAALNYGQTKASCLGSYTLSPDDLNLPGAIADEPKRVKNRIKLRLLDTVVNQQSAEHAITGWSVREVLCEGLTERTRHLLGYKADEGLILVTSSVESFDPAHRQIQTIRGSKYRLEGQSGTDSDIDEVWAYWKEANDVTEELDVSYLYGVRH